MQSQNKRDVHFVRAHSDRILATGQHGHFLDHQVDRHICNSFCFSVPVNAPWVWSRGCTCRRRWLEKSYIAPLNSNALVAREFEERPSYNATNPARPLRAAGMGKGELKKCAMGFIANR